MNKTFANNLKKYRMAKSLTQEKVAEMLGVSVQSVSRWECGQTLPDALMLPEIALIYAITVDDLYKESFYAYDNYAQRMASVYDTTLDFDDFVRANAEFIKLEKSNTLSAEDLRIWGTIFCKMENYSKDRALFLLNSSINKSKGVEETVWYRSYAQMIDLNISIGKADIIIEELKSAIKNSPNNLEQQSLLLYALNRAKKYEDGYKKFLEMLVLYPNDWRILTMGGDICWNLEKQEKAFMYWDKAISLNSEFLDAKYSKAFAYEKLGNKEKAYDIWMEIVKKLRSVGCDIEADTEEKRAEMIFKR